MERASRLRRYLRKDYTQIVDFPVEIIGRDGQVRRYSFDDSVRLYQRRIRSAPMRYDDGELIAAEVRHCRQRIDQLRRSYLEHYGWGALRSGDVGGLLAGPLAAELVSFLRRVFAANQDGPTSLALSLVEAGSHDLLYLSCSVRKRSYFLYAFRLDGAGPPGVRDGYRTLLRQLASVPPGVAVERLFVVHEGPDVAFLLSGEGEWDGPVVGMPPDEGGLVSETAGGEYEVDLWAEGLRALHEGAVGEALRTFEVGMDAEPLRVCFAQAVGVVALLDNEPERGEFAARTGTLQHPHDPLCAYLLAVSLARQGRRVEARDTLGGRVVPGFPLLGALAALLDLRRFHVGSAWRRGGRGATIEDRYAARLVDRVRREVELAVALCVTLLVGVGVGIASVDVATVWVGALLAGVAVVMTSGAVVGGWFQRRRIDVALAGGSRPDLRLVSIELLPRERGGVH